MTTNDSELAERDTELEPPQNHIGTNKSINLLGKFTEAVAITKHKGDSKMCGGQALWTNLVSPKKTTWHSIEPSIG
jgi:hypothetical protein